LAANRIKKSSVFRLSSITVLVTVYLSHFDNHQEILYVKADNGNDNCQKIKNESTSLNNEEIKWDECKTSGTGSEKCEFFEHPLCHFSGI
jgi:hypothetical protein